MSNKRTGERGRVLSNLAMKLDHKAAGLVRKKRSVMFFRLFKKRRIEARIQGIEDAIKTIEEMDSEDA